MLIYELEFSYTMYKYEGVWREQLLSETTYQIDAYNLEQAIERVKRRFLIVTLTSVKFLFSIEPHKDFNYGEKDD